MQVPDGHDAAALGNAHGTPQPPQLLTVKIFVSQPLLSLLSQLMKPAAQLGVHANEPGEPEQVVPPCALLQALPHAAQLLTVPSVVSQPAAAVQSAKPAAQLPMVQVPVAHEAPALGNPQGTPQFPQSVKVVTLVSQPLAGLLSQLLKPAAHVGAHANVPGPPAHVVVPWPLLHVLPHAAQFFIVSPGITILRNARVGGNRTWGISWSFSY